MNWRDKVAWLFADRGGRLVLVSTLFLLLIATFTAGPFFQQRRLTRKVAEIRARGEPMSWDELNRFQPAVPDADNAALLLEQAFAKMVLPEHVNGVDVNFLPVVGLALAPPLGVVMPVEMRQASERYLSANREALELLHQAAQKPSCRWQTRYSNRDILHPGWSSLRSAFRLLSLEILMLGEQENSDATVLATMDILRLSGLNPGGGTLIGYLVDNSSHRIVMRTAERILNRYELTSNQLQALATCLTPEARGEEYLRTTLVTERGFGFSWYEGESFNELSEWLWHHQTEAILPKWATGHGIEKPASQAAQFLFMASGAYHHDLCGLLNLHDDLDAVRRHSDPNRLAAAKDFQDSVDRLPVFSRPMSRSSFVGMDLVFQKHAESTARLRCLQALLAIERYRAERGDLPASLTDLVPAYMPSVPLDPFDGCELRYRVTRGRMIKWWSNLRRNTADETEYPAYYQDFMDVLGRGYMVYSVGANRVDDGGTPLSPDGISKRDSDLTFTINR